MGLTDTSKFLSLILRHKPETIEIKLDEHGWADVSELISGISKTRPFDMKMLEEIVRTDSKQSLFHQSIKKDYFQRAGYMFIYQRILIQQLR